MQLAFDCRHWRDVAGGGAGAAARPTAAQRADAYARGVRFFPASFAAPRRGAPDDGRRVVEWRALQPRAGGLVEVRARGGGAALSLALARG